MASKALTGELMGTELEPQYDENFGMGVVNTSGVPTRQVFDVLSEEERKMMAAFTGWANSVQPSYRSRNGGLFQRDRYVAPNTISDQMRVAYAAVEEDDIVSGALDVTEALAFADCSFTCDDEDDEDIYNQIAEELDLDSRLREIWRELFTVSQVYVAVWWEDRVFKVRGETEKGNAKRKEYKVRVPTDLTILDPLRIVPVGTTIFGKERLAYAANRMEHNEFQSLIGGGRYQGLVSQNRVNQDPIVERLIVEHYVPDPVEKREIADAGFETQYLWLLNPDHVFRHTLTRPGFQRWAPVRLRSIFGILDRKQNLGQMERAHLLGATNFIVLITKGSDAIPAKQDELDNLKMQSRVVGQVPILVGDHRLKVEIITPKVDNTLKAERWNTVDSRITARVFGMFALGNYAAGAAGDDSSKLTKVVAKGLESRRKMINRALEKHIFKPMFDMNDEIKTRGKLMFHPASIALDFDSAWAMFMLQLRQDREISRDTILSQFDLNQKHEFQMLKREADKYDDTFQSQVAFSGPGDPKGPFDPATGLPVSQPGKPGAPATKKSPTDNGGGVRNGGGAAPGTGQGKPAVVPNRKSDKGRKAKVAAQLTVTITDEEGNVVAEGTPLPGVNMVDLITNGDDDDT